MKLRNKKTGDIIESEYMMLVQITSSKGERNLLFEDLAQFNEEWEDFIVREPDDEPLITDPKIRKAVRAWAEANHYENDKLTVYLDPTAISFFDEHDHDNELTFNTTEKFGLEHLKCYTVIELCGKGEE